MFCEKNAMLLVLHFLFYGSWKSTDKTNRQCHVVIVIAYLFYYESKQHLQDRGGVEDTRLEAKAEDTKKIRGQGQGQPFRGQECSRPKTEMLQAKAKDQGHKRKYSPKKKKKVLQKFFKLLHEKTFSKKFFKHSTKF